MHGCLAGSDGAAAGGALKVERGVRAALRGFGADLAAVLRHPVFASAVAGITLYTGALAAHSPAYLEFPLRTLTRPYAPASA